MQVHRAHQAGVAGDQIVEGAIGQVQLAVGAASWLVADPGEQLGQAGAVAGDLPPRLLGRARGGSETAIWRRARAYSLAVRPAPGPVRPDKRAKWVSSRPSPTSRSR